jgi:hypothetical protein
MADIACKEGNTMERTLSLLDHIFIWMLNDGFWIIVGGAGVLAFVVGFGLAYRMSEQAMRIGLFGAFLLPVLWFVGLMMLVNNCPPTVSMMYMYADLRLIALMVYCFVISEGSWIYGTVFGRANADVAKKQHSS